MRQLSDVAKPGIMISQTWPRSREKEGETLAAIETVLKDGFFKAIQTVEIPFHAERRAIRSVLELEGIPLTYCVARIMNENGLNMSDLDPDIRDRSLSRLMDCLGDAREAGAKKIMLVSGKSPADPEQREKALDYLTESMEGLCREAEKCPAIDVIIEPLDYASYKVNTLGTTTEAFRLCQTLAEKGHRLFLCLDTAHMFLNHENPIEFLRSGMEVVKEYHFCNCVTDQKHPLFGDRHLRFGSPGVMDVPFMGEILAEGLKTGFIGNGYKPVLACEILKTDDMDSIELMKNCRNTLEAAWNLALELTGV